jgi:hypothetical protein
MMDLCIVVSDSFRIIDEAMSSACLDPDLPLTEQAAADLLREIRSIL